MANFISNFFDSIFGGAPKVQSQGTTTTTSTPSLPSEIAPFAKEALGEAQRLYQMRGEEGYVPYTGQQLADFTPEQLKAFQGISSLIGTGQQYFDPAARLAASSAIAPTSESVQQFMSPYMQNVVDIQQREARRQADIEANRLAGEATKGAGGFGGSRQAILEAELGRNTQQLLGDIQAKGIAAAYEDAQNRLAQQRQREAGAASLFGQLGQQAPSTALQELTALQGVGGVQQAQQQAGLDIARQQFEAERAFPEQQLQTYMSFIRGTPPATGGTTTSTATTPAPSYLQQLAGLGLGAAGFAKAFNFKDGGKIGKGGLSSIVVKRASGGPIRLQVGGISELRGRDSGDNEVYRALFGSPEEDSSYFSSYRPTVLDFLRSQGKAVEQSVFDIENIRRRRQLASAKDAASRADAEKTYEEQRLLDMQRPPIAASPKKKLSAADKPAWMFGLNRPEFETRRAELEPKIAELDRAQAEREFSPGEKRILEVSGQTPAQAKPASGLASLADDSTMTPTYTPSYVGLRNITNNTDTSQVAGRSSATGDNMTAGGGAAFTPTSEVSGETSAASSPLMRFGEGLGNPVSAQPEKKPEAEDIFDSTRKKLAEATAAKKKGMEERSASLDQAKWLAVAELGASILAQPGGQSFLQAIGKGAKESGIVSKVAALNDKQKELASNLADLDTKQIMDEFNISKAKADQIDRDRKTEFEGRKVVVEERGAGARDITADAARRTADAAMRKAMTDEKYRENWVAVQMRNADIKEAVAEAKQAITANQMGSLAKIMQNLANNGDYEAIAVIGAQYPQAMDLASGFLAAKPPSKGANRPPSKEDIGKRISDTSISSTKP